MDDETDIKAAKEKPSQVPSWVTLGFMLGALFVLALPRHNPPPEAPARPTQPEPAVAVAKPAAKRLSTIEAVFAAWDRYAVWSGGTTEVALWNPDTGSFSDCYEVMKAGENYYFRSITGLTRRVLTHGVVSDSPLQFTETEVQRQEWLREVDRENFKAISAAAKEAFPVPAASESQSGK